MHELNTRDNKYALTCAYSLQRIAKPNYLSMTFFSPNASDLAESFLLKIWTDLLVLGVYMVDSPRFLLKNIIKLYRLVNFDFYVLTVIELFVTVFSV